MSARGEVVFYVLRNNRGSYLGWYGGRAIDQDGAMRFDTPEEVDATLANLDPDEKYRRVTVRSHKARAEDWKASALNQEHRAEKAEADVARLREALESIKNGVGAGPCRACDRFYELAEDALAKGVGRG